MQDWAYICYMFFLKDYACIIIIFQGWVSQNYSKIYHKTCLKINIRSDFRQSGARNIKHTKILT